MSDANGGAGAKAAQQQVRMQVLSQFIKDLSFENALAQRGTVNGEVQPDIQVQVSLDAQKRAADHQFEVVQKYKIDAKNRTGREPLFLLEIEYSGIFHIEGVPEEQLHPFLLIECPRLVFPFVRRIVSDLTRDGGFPPLNLDVVDFLALYRQEIARRQQQTGTA
jgi:preprotein translocase subunit SecB